MHYKLLIITLFFTLFGCGESHKAPVANITLPATTLSFQSIIIASDTENDSATYSWHLTSDTGLDLHFTDITKVAYEIPPATTDTQYTVLLNVEDNKGNQTSTTKNFTVPAITVDFSLPFGATSQRYVDIEANISNINDDDVELLWELSSDNNYPLSTISQKRVRFFAEKPLTTEYDANENRGAEFFRGAGQEEDVNVKLSITHEGNKVDFSEVININAIQNITPWPVHDVIIDDNSNSYGSYGVTIIGFNGLLTTNCLNNKQSTKIAVDYNQDDLDDYFCFINNSLYFYLSGEQVNDSGSSELFFNPDDDFLVISNNEYLDNAILMDFNDDQMPELVLIDKLKNIMILSFNAQTNQLEQNQAFQLNEDVYSYNFIELDNKLFLAYSSAGEESNTPIVKVFDFNSFSLQELSEMQLDAYTLSMKDLVVSNIDEQGKAEILIETESEIGLNSTFKSLHILKDPYVNAIKLPFLFTDIYRENIDDDEFEEWLGIRGMPIAQDNLKAAFLLYLSFDSNDEISTTVLENYYSDLFFNYQAIPTRLDLNQDGELENLIMYVSYEGDDFINDIYLTYTLANQQRMLITTIPTIDGTYSETSYPIGVADMDNDGDLDIKMGIRSTATHWLENINGYPLNY